MNGLGQLIRRDCKLFFKDKGLFFSSLISPLILLVLYATFLGRIYRDSFTSALPEGLSFNPALLDATVAGQLISSLLAVCCVTVAVCANLQMVSDKVSGARRDLAVSPVRSSAVSLAYFCASSLVTLIVNFVAVGLSMISYTETQKIKESSFRREPVKWTHRKVIVIAKMNSKLCFEVLK